MKARLALLSLLISCALHAETEKFTVLVHGGTTKAGHQYVTRDDDGNTKVEFIFKDNGRGPELKEEFKVDKDSTFTRYHVEGTSTFGALINESFERNGNKVQWKSTSDKGEQEVFGTALYTPLGGAPADMSVVIEALSKRADGKLPLIPGGTMTWSKLVESEVTNGGEKKKVRLVALTGIGFTPTFVWITEDAQPHMFAFIFPGFAQMLPEGW